MKIEQCEKIAREHDLDPNNFIKALNHAFSLKIIGRSYDPPIIIDDNPKTKKAKREELTKLVTARVNEYTAIFSKNGENKHGLIPGALGTKKAVIKNMVDWLIENDEYTFNDVLVAADYYVDLESKKNFEFLKNSNRFIMHQKESKLSALIGEALSSPLEAKIYTTI